MRIRQEMYGAVLTTLLLILVVFSPVIGAKITITHYHHSWHGQTWQTYISQMKQLYEQAHPDVEIDIVVVPGHEYLAKATVSTAGGVAPDILEVYPDSAAPYLEKGLILPLNDRIAKDPAVNLSRLIPQVVKDFTWKGDIWALPISTYPIITVYNTALLDSVGLVGPYELGDAWTWETVTDYARKLTVTDAEGETQKWGVQPYYSLNRWPIFVHQAGGSLYDQPTDPQESCFNTKPVTVALTWLQDLYHTYAVAPLSLEMADLARGDLAINLSSGPTILHNPAITSGQYGAISLRTAPMPFGPANNGTGLFVNGFQIGSGSAHPDAAWDWIRFLTMDEENVLSFMKLTARPPAMLPLLSKYLRALPDYDGNAEKNAAAIAQQLMLPHNMPDTVTPYTADIDRVVTPLVSQVLQGELSPAGAQEQMHALVTAILRSGSN